ncbi:hypothetical protein ACFFHM_17450, partial [Halalkalibacter kiskunsagensis]
MLRFDNILQSSGSDRHAILDSFGRTNTLMMVYGLTALIMFYMSTGAMNYPTFLLSVSLIGFCFGGFLALFPSVTA